MTEQEAVLREELVAAVTLKGALRRSFQWRAASSVLSRTQAQSRRIARIAILRRVCQGEEGVHKAPVYGYGLRCKDNVIACPAFQLSERGALPQKKLLKAIARQRTC